MLAPLLLGVALVGSPKFDFYADKPYDAAIPKPDTTLGYALGEKTTNFRDQERALMAIATASGRRVKVIEYGKSWEGRPLRIYVVSTPENMARLEEIRMDNAERAEGRETKPNDPVCVWVNECIHGDETASFESGMALLYNLAASRSEKISKLMQRAVVMINPSFNPDGHERYTVYYNSISTGSPEQGAFEESQPALIHGRLNHYRFDMNRDRVALSQTETRQEIAEFLKWHPQVYVDQHGQVETYFFPPNSMSQNVNVDRDRVNKWTDIFGRATGKAFDEHGWTYFVKDTFDLYYPGYLDAFTTLSGAIGMTHETDGGRLVSRLRRDGSKLTLRDGAMKHFTSALAVAQAAVDHHDDLLQSYVSYKKRAVSGEIAGKFQRVILEGDRRALQRLHDQLNFAGIASSFAPKTWSQKDAHDYWSTQVGSRTFSAGSLVVDMAQSQGPIAKALLEPGSDFEPEFTKAQLAKKKTAPDGETNPGPDGAEFYDTTAWSLPYAHNLKAWWCESSPALVRDGGADRMAVSLWISSSVGYALEYRDDEDALAVAEALRQGLRVSVTTKPITVGAQSLPRGTFLFLSARNEDGYDVALRAIAQRHGSVLKGLESSYPEAGRQGPGSENVIQLRKPKIGVVFGSGSNMADVGSMWYLMDQVWHLPFVPLSSGVLGGDLSSYTCIVVPDGAGVSVTGKLKEWVGGGGCLVALGSPGWALGSNGFVDLSAVGGDHQYLPGAIFKAELDPRSFLSFGYPAPASGSISIAAPIEGGGFFKSRKEGGSVVRFSDDDKAPKLLSGWSWPDDTEKGLAGSVWLQDVPSGGGHVCVFTYDPTSRAMWPGLYRLLLNAMLIGPSA